MMESSFYVLLPSISPFHFSTSEQPDDTHCLAKEIGYKLRSASLLAYAIIETSIMSVLTRLFPREWTMELMTIFARKIPRRYSHVLREQCLEALPKRVSPSLQPQSHWRKLMHAYQALNPSFRSYPGFPTPRGYQVRHVRFEKFATFHVEECDLWILVVFCRSSRFSSSFLFEISAFRDVCNFLWQAVGFAASVCWPITR